MIELQYNEHRYYDPSNGRFISADPSGMHPDELNVYRYSHNDPINRADINGLDDWPTGEDEDADSEFNWFDGVGSADPYGDALTLSTPASVVLPASSFGLPAADGYAGYSGGDTTDAGTYIDVPPSLLQEDSSGANMFQDPYWFDSAMGQTSPTFDDLALADDLAADSGPQLWADNSFHWSSWVPASVALTAQGTVNMFADIANTAIGAVNFVSQSAYDIGGGDGGEPYLIPSIPQASFAHANYYFPNEAYYQQAARQYNVVSDLLPMVVPVFGDASFAGEVGARGFDVLQAENAAESGRIFYGTPQGQLIEAPPGYQAVTAQNGKGLLLLPEGQTLGNNMNAIRYGEPNAQNPAGYFRYYNGEAPNGQPLAPSSGNPGSNAATHIPLNYEGPLVNYPGR